MKLTIAESFYVLIHHPDKPRVLVPETARNAGMIGAMFLDLSLDENIIIEEGVIKVKSLRSELPQVHKDMLDKIANSAKKRKPKWWISRFTQTANKFRRPLLENLEKSGFLDLIPRKFLFIPYTQTYLLKKDEREKMIAQLRGVVFQNKEFDHHLASMLGLIQATKMFKLIADGPEERKQCKIRIKEIVESDVFMKGVGTVIQEMQAAMMAAIIASTAATTVVTSGS